MIQLQDIEFPATAEALSAFYYHHKELPPVLNIFSAGEKDLKKINYEYLLPKILNTRSNAKKNAVSLKFQAFNQEIFQNE